MRRLLTNHRRDVIQITISAFMILFTAGCLEKQSEVDEALKNMPEFNEGMSKQAPSAGGEASSSGMPETPTPQPVQGTPTPVQGSPEAPPSPPTPFEEKYAGKPMITLSGEIVFKDYKGGVIDIDCFIPKPSIPAKRELVNKVKLDKIGQFAMKVPANFGKMYISAFIDLDGNGPDPSDPRGEYSGNPIEVKDKDISGININLQIEKVPR